MIRLPSRLLVSRKFWQRGAFTIACIATLLAAFYAIEDYRGKTAWERYRTEAKGRGVKLDFKDFIPPPIPDEENFAAVPILGELASVDPAVRARAERASDLPRPAQSAAIVEGRNGAQADFDAWRNVFVEHSFLPAPTENPIADVLTALERYEPLFAQLREASARPRSRIAAGWEKGMGADFYRIGGGPLSLARILSLRVVTLLALDRTSEAMADWRALYRLSAMLQSEPTLLSAMMRQMLLTTSLNSISQGLAARQWTEQQLQEFETHLSPIDLLTDFGFALSSERAFINSVIDQAKSTPRWKWPTLFGVVSGNTALLFVPRGWFDQNQLRINQSFDRELRNIHATAPQAAFDAVSREHAESTRTWASRRYWHLWETTFYGLGPNLKIFQVENTVQCSRVACALERFRLRTGDYPEALEELESSGILELPRDAFTGQPFRYRRIGADDFVVYSVGEDGRDDGGDKDKDWTWRFHSVKPDERR